MEPKAERNIPLMVGAAIVLLAAVAALYFAALPKPANDIPARAAEPDVAADISAAAQTPADKLPETNPYQNYKNPFE